MKKPSIPVLILAALLTLSLCACSAAPAPAETPPVAPPVQSEPPAAEVAPAPPAESPADVVPEAPIEVTPEAPAEATAEVEPVPQPVEPSPAPQPETPAVDAADFVYYEKIPILMYHEVNDLVANSLYLSVADFTAHLDYFEQAGVNPISMQQLYDHWFNAAPLPEKPIVLTFDDGYSTMYWTVYPLLKERGWSGTFYCITSTTETPGHLTAGMIAEMAAGGMEIGSHTVSHLELNTLGSERLRRELAESREILAALSGQQINTLCYPAGRYNDATKVSAADTPYLSAVTTQYGFASKSQGMFDLKRIRVSTDCGAAWIESVLAPLGY